MEQPEQRPQRQVFGIHELHDPELLARAGNPRDYAAVVDPCTIRRGRVEERDALWCQLQHRSLVLFDLTEILPHGVAAIEPDLA